MAEALCNNPNAISTSRGYTAEKPCGVLDWCTKKHYSDWLARYKTTISVAEAQFNHLKKIKIINKTPSFTEEEELVKHLIETSSLNYKVLQEELLQKKDLDYSQKINDVIQKIGELNCAIENTIQNNIDILGGPQKPTGLISGSRESFGSQVGTVLLWGGAGIVALWVLKNI